MSSKPTIIDYGDGSYDYLDPDDDPVFSSLRYEEDPDDEVDYADEEWND